MKKIIILSILIGLISLSLVSAVCCSIGQNCTITETCQEGNCGDCHLKIYYPNATINQEGDFINLNNYLYQYNTTSPFQDFLVYPYTINCTTGNTCISGDCSIQMKQMCEDVDMGVISIIILLPIFLTIIFLVISAILGKEHIVLKIFFLLLSLVSFFVALHSAALTLIKYFNFTELGELIGTTAFWYGMIFIAIVVYFMIYITAKIINYMAGKKEEKLNY